MKMQTDPNLSHAYAQLCDKAHGLESELAKYKVRLEEQRRENDSQDAIIRELRALIVRIATE